MQAIAILVLGWGCFWVYARPGYLSFDSVWQLREARSGELTDWHPPAMAALWRVIDHVVAGPWGMLVLQSLTFVVGLFLVLGRYADKRLAALFASAILCFHPSRR